MDAKDGNSVQDQHAPRHKSAVVPIPLGNKVIVKQDEASVRIGMIYIPGQSQEAPLIGEVVSVGPGNHDLYSSQLIPMEIQKGDRVMFSRFAGYNISVMKEDFKVLNEGDIHCRMPRLGEPQYDEYLLDLEESKKMTAKANPEPKPSPLAQALMAAPSTDTGSLAFATPPKGKGKGRRG